MQKAHKKHIDQAWSSLQKITGVYTDRNQLTVTLIQSLLSYLSHFDRHGLVFFNTEWQERDCLFAKAITITSVEKRWHGTAAGINNQGQLILKLADNSKKIFSSGDASLSK
jgi:BirA family biotin operon repressor/biotin-[acetyl-CoA-carboxylase] ligase